MTTTPISSETTIVRVSITRSVVGRSMPIASKSDVEQDRDQVAAGDADQRAEQPDRQRLDHDGGRIWRREAPSVRSIPNSVTRWATVIEKVLKIRKAPTKSGDEGEDEQQRLQEAEVVADFVGAAVGAFFPGFDLDRAGITRLDPPFSAAA